MWTRIRNMGHLPDLDPDPQEGCMRIGIWEEKIAEKFLEL